MHAGMQAQLLTCVQLFVTPWTAAHQAPLSMGFSRLEYRSGLPFSPSGDLPNPGIELESPEPPALVHHHGFCNLQNGQTPNTEGEKNASPLCV